MEEVEEEESQDNEKVASVDKNDGGPPSDFSKDSDEESFFSDQDELEEVNPKLDGEEDSEGEFGS